MVGVCVCTAPRAGVGFFLWWSVFLKFWHHWGRSWQVIRRRMLPVWLPFNLRRNNQRSCASTQTLIQPHSTHESSLFPGLVSQGAWTTGKVFPLPSPAPFYFSVCLLKWAQSAQPASANAVLIFISFNGPCKSYFLKLPYTETGGVKQMGGREMCWWGNGQAKGLNPGSNTSIWTNPEASSLFVANVCRLNASKCFRHATFLFQSECEKQSHSAGSPSLNRLLMRGWWGWLKCETPLVRACLYCHRKAVFRFESEAKPFS